MAQKRSQPDSGLLSPALLNQIRAWLLKYLRDNPPDMKALMEQGIDFIESLIRYRLREKLDPAPEKEPVLGGIGVAFGPGDFQWDCTAFLESSWAYLPNDTQSFVYLTDEVTTATELDNLDVASQTFSFDSTRTSGYTDGMVSLAFPNSEKRSYHLGNKNTQTGKLRLLFQSVMGNNLIDLTSVVAPFVEPNTKDESYGLFSSSTSFEHWLIKISGGVIQKAKLNYNECGNRLKQVLDSNYTPRSDRDEIDVRWESYLFTMINESDTWVNIGTYPTISGNPVFYGFNFNWDGTEAVMVTQETVSIGGVAQHVTSRTYTLAITGTDEPLSATITETTNGNWTPRIDDDRLWIPDETSEAKMYFWYPCNCCSSWGSGTQYGTMPVYAWYHDDGEIGQLQYEREQMSTVSNVTAARDAWLASIETCGSMADSESFFSAPASRAGFITTKNGALQIDATGFNGTTGLYYRVSVDLTHTSETTECMRTPSNISSMCDWNTVDFADNSCQLNNCDSSNTRALTRQCGEVHTEREQLRFTSISNQSAAVIPFHSPESIFVLKQERSTGLYDLSHRDSTGFIGYIAYQPVPPQPCSFSEITRGELITPTFDAAVSTTGCTYTNVPTTFYNDEPWSIETIEYWFVPPNQTLIKLDDERYDDVAGQLPSTGYNGLVNAVTCGPNPYPYYDLKIKNDESACYRDRFYYGSLLTTPDHVADTRVSITYASSGLWEGWV